MSCLVNGQPNADSAVEVSSSSFIRLSDDEAKEYFIQLFVGSLERIQLESIWYSIPKHANASMHVLLSVERAVGMLEAQELQVMEEQDGILAAKLLKAEHRSGSKKRNKMKKKATNELTAFLNSPIGSALAESEVAAFFAVKEVLEQCTYHYRPESIIEVLKQCNFDANAAVERLLSFKDENESSSPPTVNTSRFYSSVSRTSQNSTGNPEQSMRNPAPTSATMTICVDNASPEPALSALTQYYLMLLRHRNPGIVAYWDGEALLYRGTRAEVNVFENTGELVVSIDLHGQTRKPAVDMLQSSLLYYHNILLTRNYDQCLNISYINNGKVYAAVSNKPRSAEIKSIVVIYVVGQGIHSPGAVPVLRNTLMSELQTFWAIFEAAIDPENQGQIVVKIRR